jgi:hypothetical protein
MNRAHSLSSGHERSPFEIVILAQPESPYLLLPLSDLLFVIPQRSGDSLLVCKGIFGGLSKRLPMKWI